MKEKQKLYVKLPNGRYTEYKEPVQEYDNKLYRKIGKKYEPCSMLMTNDLPEGVWVVVKQKHSKSMSSGRYLYEKYMCMKSGDIQDVSLAKLGGIERVTDYLLQHWDELPQNVSQYDLIRAIVGLVFNSEKDK